MALGTSTIDRTTLPVIALVTAYNEAGTVGEILAVLKACPAIDRIQVVDDGSTDATAAIARTAGVTVISLPHRVPVGEAIMHHLPGVDGEAILLWCDADLLGLTCAHMTALVDRFRTEGVTQSMSSRGVPPNWPGWLRNRVTKALWGRLFGPISGERAILRSDFSAAIALAHKLEWAEMMRGYGIVLFLNWYAAVYGRGSVVTYFDDLRQRQKYQKWGGNPVGEMIRQWAQFIAVWLKIRWHASRIKTLAAQEGGSAF